MPGHSIQIYLLTKVTVTDVEAHAVPRSISTNEDAELKRRKVHVCTPFPKSSVLLCTWNVAKKGPNQSIQYLAGQLTGEAMQLCTAHLFKL